MKSEYSDEVAQLEKSVRAGTISPTEKWQEASRILDRSLGGQSCTDGLDWVEMELVAKERQLPLNTVADLLVLRKSST